MAACRLAPAIFLGVCVGLIRPRPLRTARAVWVSGAWPKPLVFRAPSSTIALVLESQRCSSLGAVGFATSGPGAWKPLARRHQCCRRKHSPNPCGRGGTRACPGGNPKGVCGSPCEAFQLPDHGSEGLSMTEFAAADGAVLLQKYCHGCGATIHKSAPLCPRCGARQFDVERPRQPPPRGGARF